MLAMICRKRNPCALSVGTQIDAALWKKRMEFPQKIKHRITLCPRDSTSRNISEEMQNTDLKKKKKSTPVFIAALFAIAKIWK